VKYNSLYTAELVENCLYIFRVLLVSNLKSFNFYRNDSYKNDEVKLTKDLAKVKKIEK